MNTYFALTIGPIYKTLSQAQKTREFWGSSYMFSWIMREIIVGLINDKKTIESKDILMPHRDKHNNLKVGTGLYHDRMIAEINPEKKGKVLADFKGVADSVIGEIAKHTGVPLSVLHSYFRLNAVLFDLEEGKNIVETVTNYLDSLELQNPIFHNSWQIDWPDIMDKLNGSFFYRDAFIRGGDFNFVFDSISEIASRGLRDTNPKEYDQLVNTFIKGKFVNGERLPKKIEFEIQDKFINQLSISSVLKEDFRNYHKYIAIVHADGDNLGKTISKIGNSPKEVKNLSKLLFDFASNAATEIGKYGGANVYAGGDDLLFFAPVATMNSKVKRTIFNLIDDLDIMFKEKVSDELTVPDRVTKPTLSWGVSISYYKFPLSEAIVSSRELLFEKAKEFEGKNAVAFKLIKHSGQTFGTTFGKSSKDYSQNFTGLLKQTFNTDTDFISSLQYRIADNEVLLCETFKTSDYKTRIGNFFDNFFDEEVHSNKKAFIHSVRDMLIQTFDDTILPNDYSRMSKDDQDKTHEKRVKTAIDKTYSALRFIHFLNSKSDE